MWSPVVFLGLLSFQTISAIHFFKIPGIGQIFSSYEEVGDDINYLLSDRSTKKEKWDAIVVNNITEDLVNKHFNKSAETKIIIHGWEGSCYHHNWYAYTITKAYTDTGLYNVICVDWSRVANKSYPVARWDMPKVGGEVASFLDKLAEAGIEPGKTHVVAHSLGAHVAGTAGLGVRTKIARITGLDPAGPLFIVPEKNILKPESADFVDVIHTCGHYKSLMAPLGHVDFYPNRGTYKQPGCGHDFGGDCSHSRCYQFYTESITNPGRFKGIKCEEWNYFLGGECEGGEIVEMGERVDKRARGKFYLRTSDKSPFGLSDEGVKPLK